MGHTVILDKFQSLQAIQGVLCVRTTVKQNMKSIIEQSLKNVQMFRN